MLSVYDKVTYETPLIINICLLKFWLIIHWWMRKSKGKLLFVDNYLKLVYHIFIRITCHWLLSSCAFNTALSVPLKWSLLFLKFSERGVRWVCFGAVMLATGGDSSRTECMVSLAWSMAFSLDCNLGTCILHRCTVKFYIKSTFGNFQKWS